jgi:hypothetical protein
MAKTTHCIRLLNGYERLHVASVSGDRNDT